MSCIIVGINLKVMNFEEIPQADKSQFIRKVVYSKLPSRNLALLKYLVDFLATVSRNYSHLPLPLLILVICLKDPSLKLTDPIKQSTF